MEVLKELHSPRRVDFRIADPNSLAYQSHELVEVGLSNPAHAYNVEVIHAPLVSIIARLAKFIASGASLALSHLALFRHHQPR
jgi:hypothetical protein